MQKLHAKLSGGGALQISVLSSFGIVVVGALDWVTGNEISFGVFYLLPICFGTWYAGFELGVILCLVSAGTWLAADTVGANRPGYPFVPVWNALVRLSFFLIVTYLLARLRGLTEKLELLVQKRTSALEAEVTERKRIQAEMAELEDKELGRLSQELHDTVGSYLAGIAFRAKTLSEELSSRNAQEKSGATELVKLINTSISNVRNVSRLLTPIEPEDQDLKSALSRLCAEIESCFGIVCSFEAPNQFPRLDHDAAEQLCRIAQEAIRNAIQHAQPKAIGVQLRMDADLVRLLVQNDGKSWEPDGLSLKRGLGLRIMRNRTERIGGKFLITAGVHGGTCIQCDIPLKNNQASLRMPADSPGLPQKIEEDGYVLAESSKLRAELPKLKITAPQTNTSRNGLRKRGRIWGLTKSGSQTATQRSPSSG